MIGRVEALSVGGCSIVSSLSNQMSGRIAYISMGMEVLSKVLSVVM